MTLILDENKKIDFDNIPAIDCPLSGAYLIEASAGTGKTWTLTGIILRLLIEKRVAPENIVATTFTKSAAKEIQERVFQRVQSLDYCCEWLQTYIQKDNLYLLKEKQVISKIVQINQNNDDFLDNESLKNALSDPINQYMLSYIISLGEDKLNSTINYIKLLLFKIDKLFIGTIDSLAQKWLKEFVYDGERLPELLHDDNDIIYNIIHDELRVLHSQIKYQNPFIYELMDKTIFGDVPAVQKGIENALNYFTAPLDDIVLIDENYICHLTNNIRLLIKDLLCINDFFIKNENCFKGSPNFKGQFKTIQFFLTDFNNQGIQTFDNNIKTYQSFFNFIQNNKNMDNVFLKKYSYLHDEWFKLNLSVLYKLADIYIDYQNISNNANQYVIYYIAKKLRQKLPVYLKTYHNTTYLMTMMSLIDTLQKDKNIKAQIRHRYPVALIDEAQDINGEQALLLKHIYLEDSAKSILYPKFFNIKTDKNNNDKGFLLLVGDPKQAIYRFRGSDVANYTMIKNMGLNTRLKLTQNRRSNDQIIDILNHWFTDDLNEFGQGICYDNICAVKFGYHFQFNHATPIQIIGVDDYQQIALHISQVLHHATINQIPIKPPDIAVLADKHRKLVEVKKSLRALNIDAQNSQELHIFQTDASLAIYQLLLTILTPSIQNLTTFLTSKMVCFDLNYAQRQLNDNVEFKNVLFLCFKKTQYLWENYDILKALDYLLFQKIFDNQNSWQIMSKLVDNGEYLTDTRQLLDILSAQKLSSTAMIDWYKKQMITLPQKDEYKKIPIIKNDSINMMTIFKSKGLEFKIVYIIGLDEGISNKNNNDKDKKLYAYHDGIQRRLSANPLKQINQKTVNDLNIEEILEEKRRLAYVALTRASEQVFVIAKKNDTKQAVDKYKNSALYYWQFTDTNTKDIPKRLESKVNWTDIDEDRQIINTPILTKQLTKIHYLDFDSAYPKQSFESFYRTSFTAMVQILDNYSYKKIDPSDYQVADYDEKVAKTDIILSKNDVFSARFLKGVQAGIFLHKVLENMPYRKIDIPNNAFEVDKNELSKIIDNLAYNISELQYIVSNESVFYTIENNEHNALIDWLVAIANTPFLSSNLSLINLKNNHCVCQSELRFSLSLGDNFVLTEFIAVFNAFSDKKINIFSDDTTLYQLLSGEIDLVYEAFGKYYIVDYKSNFLAKSPAGYTIDVMTACMDDNYYWLQAVIYQVALHRLLSVRIKDYVGNEQNYLGGVEYVFLRGVDNYATADNNIGRLNWHIPFELIKNIDTLFGRHDEYSKN